MEEEQLHQITDPLPAVLAQKSGYNLPDANGCRFETRQE